LANAVNAGERVSEILWALWDGQWPQQLRAESLAGGIASLRAGRDLDAVGALFDLAAEHFGWLGAEGLNAFVSLVANQDLPMDIARESRQFEDSVQVLSPFEAKGRRWPAVIIAGATEGAWPRTSGHPDLLGVSRLTPNGPSYRPGLSEQLQADRRAFLLALSRASDQVLITGSAELDGEPAAISRFVLELGATVTQVTSQQPQLQLSAQSQSLQWAGSLRDLANTLRRVGGGADTSAGVREATAALLGWLAAQRTQSGRLVVPSAVPERWWSARPLSSTAKPQLTPFSTASAPNTDGRPLLQVNSSWLGQLLACPRLWFLARRAGADLPFDAAANLGTLIHGFFEQDARRQLAGDSPLDESTVLVAATEFAAAREVPAWQQTGIITRVLNQFRTYRRWTDSPLRSTRTLVGAELNFSLRVSVPQADVQINGKVDRLEQQDDGKLIVVDFKTGATGDAFQYQDQLACYELGTQTNAWREPPGVSGPVGSPELVWPAMPKNAEPGCRVSVLPTLADQPHRDIRFDDPSAPTWFHARLGQAAQILLSGEFPAVPGTACRYCRFQAGCPALTKERVSK
jgi:ATP-dependent exoDNAse (exonuclease V) beta subunit